MWILGAQGVAERQALDAARKLHAATRTKATFGPSGFPVFVHLGMCQNRDLDDTISVFVLVSFDIFLYFFGQVGVVHVHCASLRLLTAE